jgi:uncharacterized protein YqiB (DUF1249 family)
VRGGRAAHGIYLPAKPCISRRKTQLNLFLGEWLSHCLACGHELAPVQEKIPIFCR